MTPNEFDYLLLGLFFGFTLGIWYRVPRNKK